MISAVEHCEAHLGPLFLFASQDLISCLILYLINLHSPLNWISSLGVRRWIPDFNINFFFFLPSNHINHSIFQYRPNMYCFLTCNWVPALLDEAHSLGLYSTRRLQHIVLIISLCLCLLEDTNRQEAHVGPTFPKQPIFHGTHFYDKKNFET